MRGQPLYNTVNTNVRSVTDILRIVPLNCVISLRLTESISARMKIVLHEHSVASWYDLHYGRINLDCCGKSSLSVRNTEELVSVYHLSSLSLCLLILYLILIYFVVILCCSFITLITIFLLKSIILRLWSLFCFQFSGCYFWLLVILSRILPFNTTAIRSKQTLYSIRREIFMLITSRKLLLFPRRNNLHSVAQTIDHRCPFFLDVAIKQWHFAQCRRLSGSPIPLRFCAVTPLQIITAV